MATTQPNPTDEPIDAQFRQLLAERYRDAVGQLAQRYPTEQKGLVVTYDDLYTYSFDLAQDLLGDPEQVLEYFEAGLRQFDLPADVALEDAHVRVTGLPDELTFYPGRFSPTAEAGTYRALTGEVSKVSDTYSKITEAAFECQRCGVMSYVPQTDSGFQEPHECQGCERQGPFRVNFDQSAFVDAQQLRLATPPEIGEAGGTTVDVHLEDDLAGTATAGDRVTATGVLHLEQKTSGNEKTGKFEPYMDAQALTVEETDYRSADVSPDERDRIHELAAGAEGPPLELAAASLAPKIHGYESIKKILILAMVGGSKTVYGPEDHDRGQFHVLLLGDPGTAKSKLIDRVEDLGWRTVGVSGKGATVAGVTASAVQDDFGDGSASLEAGAFVKAHQGTVCIDELDDMPEDVRAAMLDPMSKQRIAVNKWGINATLRTETAVVTAGNPEYGRFDPYEPIPDQFDFESNLLSRFDLVFTLTDRPDPDDDETIGYHIADARDAAKREMAGKEVADDLAETIATPIDRDLLRKWVALAKQAPEPVFADDSVKEWLIDSFADLRGLNGYDDDSAVPVTFRKLEGIIRVAEAAAKFEFSETIEQDHVRFATRVVGESMQDYATDEDGQLDADVAETGTSHSQQQKMKLLADVIKELQGETGADREAVVDALEGEEIAAPHGVVDKAKEQGLAYNTGDGLRWVGGA